LINPNILKIFIIIFELSNKIIQISFILIVFLIACDQQSTDKKNSKIQEEVIVDNLKTDSLSLLNNLNAFSKLELFFDNSNYMVVNGRDTNFFYFSRSSDFLIKVHQFKMIKGDSSFLKIDSIQVVGGRDIQWKFEDQKLTLISSSESANSWKANSLDSSIFAFKKINKKDFQLLDHQNSKTRFSQTITFSSFLVRSFYDYQHGTRYAFDTTNFTKKTGKIKPLF
jgi:hypothetical protein